MAHRKLLALGDSVVWGQGLAENHKFVRLVQQFLQQGGNTVALASLARSGAIIDLAPQKPALHTPFLFGELPRSFPSILSELSIARSAAGFGAYLEPKPWDRQSWKNVKADLAQQIAGYTGATGVPPDPIILDGGINDLRALQIVLPWSLHDGNTGMGEAALEETNVQKVLATLDEEGGMAAEAAVLPELHWMTDEEFKALIERFFIDRMRGLLAQVGQGFPSSRVIVLGYFPIFTPGSLGTLTGLSSWPAVATLMARSQDRDEQRAALGWALHFNVDPAEYANRVIQQSKIWYEFGTQRLREIVAEANATFGNRFAVASPIFGPDNGALAPHSLLWTLGPVADFILREILRLFGPAAPSAEALELPSIAGFGQALAFLSGYTLGAGLATDEVTGDRSVAARSYYVGSSTGRDDPDTTFFGGFTTSVASVGHPNVQGAKVYADAIKPLLP